MLEVEDRRGQSVFWQWELQVVFRELRERFQRLNFDFINLELVRVFICLNVRNKLSEK